MQLDVCVCLCVPDSKQERQGPAFLYDGFDHSPEPVYRHPDIRDKKIIPPSWFQKKITSTTATRDSQVIFADKPEHACIQHPRWTLRHSASHEGQAPDLMCHPSSPFPR